MDPKSFSIYLESALVTIIWEGSCFVFNYWHSCLTLTTVAAVTTITSVNIINNNNIVVVPNSNPLAGSVDRYVPTYKYLLEFHAGTRGRANKTIAQVKSDWIFLIIFSSTVKRAEALWNRPHQRWRLCRASLRVIFV